MKGDFLLVDGKNALWRAADVHQDLGLRQDDGKFIETGAIYGFLTILCKVHTEFSGNVVICWDDWKDGPAARKALYADYKNKGKGRVTPLAEDVAKREFIESMHTQQHQLMAILELAGVYQAYSPGWEADDVMGTLAARFGKGEEHVNILTGDRDLLQCARGNVHVCRPQPKSQFKIETPQTVEAEWGVPVEKFADLKALMGDAGDNIPGCPGIGKVGAAKIMTHFSSVEQACSKATVASDAWPKGLSETLRKKLAENAEIIALSKQLAQINCNVPLRFRARYPDKQRLVDLFVKLGFKTMLHGGRWETLMKMGELSF